MGHTAYLEFVNLGKILGKSTLLTKVDHLYGKTIIKNLVSPQIGDLGSQEIAMVGPTVLARLLETQTWNPLAPTGWMWRRLNNKKTVASTSTSVLDKAALAALALKPVHFLPVCSWCFSRCFPSSGQQSR